MTPSIEYPIVWLATTGSKVIKNRFELTKIPDVTALSLGTFDAWFEEIHNVIGG